MTDFDKRLVKIHFSKAAKDYAAHALVQHEIGKRLAERLEYMLVQPTRILDLAAGTGAGTEALKQRFPNAQIIACDLSWNMLVENRKQHAKTRDFVTADMDFLPFADNTFDLIYANCAVHWSSSLKTVFAECQRILVKGGLFLFSTLGPETFYELRESFSHVNNKPHVHDFSDLHEIGDALSRSHFYEPVVDREFIDVTYDSVQSLLKDLKRHGVQNVNPERSRGLMTPRQLVQLCQAYEQHKTVDGLYPLHYEIIYGQAWAVELPQGFGTGETYIPLSAIPIIKKLN